MGRGIRVGSGGITIASHNQVLNVHIRWLGQAGLALASAKSFLSLHSYAAALTANSRGWSCGARRSSMRTRLARGFACVCLFCCVRGAFAQTDEIQVYDAGIAPV